ncbi:MAG: T9SS type A sorting domain-containing protein [Marinilabiliaceae bacterium]
MFTFLKKALTSVMLFSGLFYFSSPGYASQNGVPTKKSTTADQEVTVLTGRRFQTMEGFGTCLVAWRNDMKDIYKTETFRDQYVYDMGMNILRVNLWGEVLMNEVENPEDISHNNFDKDHAKVGCFVDFAKAMQQRTDDVKVIGSVWSPPAWMKYNNNITDSESSSIAWNDYQGLDNRIKEEYYDHYVAYLVEWAKWFEAEGIGFYGLSIANEPRFSQTFESCVWTAEDYAEVAGRLGKKLEEEGLGHIRLFGPELMTSSSIENTKFLEALMEDPDASQHFDIFATHGYSDGVNPKLEPGDLTFVRDKIEPYSLDFWVTEGGTKGHDWPEPVSGGVANYIHSAFVHGNVNAFVPWQVSDPNRNTHGLMHLDEMTKKSYAFQQYGQFINAGDTRVGVSPKETEEVASSAYLNKENKTLVIVMINHSDTEVTHDIILDGLTQVDPDAEIFRTSATENMEQLSSLAVQEKSFDVTLPAKSISTVRLSNVETDDVLLYDLEVWYGEGAGLYEEGKNVTLIANDPAEGKEFDKWKGDIEYVDDIYSPETTVTMPAQDILVRAFYKTATGLNSLSGEKEFSLSPNPVNNENTLTITSAKRMDEVSIFSVSGRLISKWPANGKKSVDVNVSSLSKGAYIIGITEKGSGKKFIRKLIK